MIPDPHSMLTWVGRASIEASIIGMLVLAAQFALRRRISARWRYNLWLLVLVRLLLPGFPGSRYSPFNLIRVNDHSMTSDRLTEPDENTGPIPMPRAKPFQPHEHDLLAQISSGEQSTAQVREALDSANHSDDRTRFGKLDEISAVAVPARLNVPQKPARLASATSSPSEARPWQHIRFVATGAWIGRAVFTLQRWHFQWFAAGLAFWLGIAALLLIRAIVTSIRLELAMRRMPTLMDPALNELLVRCSADVGLRQPPAVLEAPSCFGPALAGVLNPRLLIPVKILSALEPAELRLVLLHELIHLRRRDVAMNWLWVALSAIHWFNPIMWWMLSRMRADRELACDEAVLCLCAAPAHRECQRYGNAMLKLMEVFCGGDAIPLAVGVLDGMGKMHASRMRRRITMVAQFKKSRGWSWGGMLATLAIAAVALTGAARGQQPPVALAGQQKSAATGATMVSSQSAQPGGIIGGRGGGQPGAAAGSTSAQGAAGQTPSPQAIQPHGSLDYLARGQVEDTAAAAAGLRTAQALHKPLTANFEAVPLKDVADFFADASGVDFFIDAKAMEAAGIPADAPITLHIRNALPADELLRLSLRCVDRDEVGYGIIHGVVHITTRSVLDQSPLTRAYNVADFAGREQELTSAVTRTIEPHSWDVNGGSGSILVIDGKLLVSASEPRQREIAKLLGLLRDNSQPVEASVKSPAISEAAAERAKREAKLTELAAQLAAIQHRFGPKHPQVQQLEQQIQTLRDQLGQSTLGVRVSALWWTARQRLQEQISDLEGQLKRLKLQGLGDSHAAVRDLQSQWEDRTQQLEKLKPVEVNGILVPHGMAEDIRRLWIEYAHQINVVNGIEVNRAAVNDQFSDEVYRRLCQRFTEGELSPQPPAQTVAAPAANRPVVVEGIQVPAEMAEQVRKLWQDRFANRIYKVNEVEQNRPQVEEEFRQAVKGLIKSPPAIQTDSAPRDGTQPPKP